MHLSLPFFQLYAMERLVYIVFIYYQKMTHSMCQVSLVVKYMLCCLHHSEATTDILVMPGQLQIAVF